MGGFGVALRLWRLMSGKALACRSLVVLCIGLEMAGVGLATLGPLLLKHLIEGAGGKAISSASLPMAVATFVVAWTGASMISAVRNVCSTKINGKLSALLTTRAIESYLAHFQPGDQSSGKMLGEFERLSYSLSVVIDGFIWRTVPLIAQFAVSLTVIVHLMSWRYLVVMVALAGGFVAASWFGARRHIETAKQVTTAYGANAGLMGDVLRNAERVVCNGAINHEVANILETLNVRAASATVMSWSMVRLTAMQYGIIAVGLFILLYMAGSDMARGSITTGDFVLIQAYGFGLVLPMAAIGFVLSQSAAAIDNISNVFSLMDSRSDDDAVRPVPAARHATRVELRDVTFDYGEAAPGVRRVSVEFPQASFSVIVGRNGSGKSTLARLIAGRLTPQSGTVTFDDLDLNQIPVADRYKTVLYVPQRAGMLDRSLIDNLTYPPASEDIASPLERLRQWDFFQSGEEIDLSLIAGEGGARLSGGQAQKLELARIVGVDVSCLILDEATSAMDPASENRALQTLLRLRGAKTTVIAVTHRPSIAEAADQVLWMQAGQLAAIGDHTELMATCPDYRAVWAIES